MRSIESEIQQLKKDREALLLAHFYEDGDIQDLADEIGDSYFLAQRGQQSTAKVILLAGVVFMAESVKLLSPEKTVLVPDLAAGCSLVEHSPYEAYLDWRRKHPKSLCITYINSSVAVKSISDVICTSSNAEKIIASIPRERDILFGPDRNLGNFLMKKTGRKMTMWPGSCQVHVLFSSRELFILKEKHPKALVIAHPECGEEILAKSDVIGSTSRLLEEVVKNTSTKEFIVATETGILHQMQKARPDALLIQAPMEGGSCGCNHCPFMKLNNLEKIRNSLTHLAPEIHVEAKYQNFAKLSLERMMRISAGHAVDWPSEFNQ